MYFFRKIDHLKVIAEQSDVNHDGSFKQGRNHDRSKIQKHTHAL